MDRVGRLMEISPGGLGETLVGAVEVKRWEGGEHMAMGGESIINIHI